MTYFRHAAIVAVLLGLAAQQTLEVRAGEDDHATMLNHALIQGRRRQSL